MPRCVALKVALGLTPRRRHNYVRLIAVALIWPYLSGRAAKKIKRT